MRLTRALMLDRARARDAAYDRRFLTGVVTTGVYCVPSCRARWPRPENVRFFHNPGEARAAGLRPCLRCRPDDVFRGHDPDLELVQEIAAGIRRRLGDFQDVGAIAEASGVGATRLHALFRRQFHTTPGAFLQRERLAAAARALLTSDLRVLDVALEVGYESLSAFNEGFRRLYRMNPRDYRRLRRDDGFALELPGDFRRELALRFLGRDPESPTERVSGAGLVRALRLSGGPARVVVDLDGTLARCRMEAGRRLAPLEMGEAVSAVLRLLGLTLDPAPFERHVRRLRSLASLVSGRRGLRIPQTPDLFEGLTWSLVGQQVHLAFAFRLRRRLLEIAGTPAGDGMVCHPAPEAVAALDYGDLARRQFSRRKAEYLIDLSRQAATGALPLDELADAPAGVVEARLRAVRGLGPWSVQYVMLRSLSFADSLPVGDSGLATAIQGFFALDHRPSGEEVAERMRPFAPFRGFATTHLWTRLGGPA